MSCPSCGQTESTVSCVECSAPTVNCPNPNPCVDVTSTDCVIYTGLDAQCHDTEPLLENGDNLSVGLKKVIDYFCEHTHIEEAKSAGGVEILSVGDGMTESFISVIDYFNDALSQMGGGGSGGAGGLLNKTHAEMVIMQSAGTFVPGQWYKITDFATMYEQPDYTGTTLATLIPVTAPVVKTSAIEPIHVQAVTQSKLNPFAFQNEYVKDVIKYELDYTTPITGTATKGRIIFRHDEYGNTTYYDHRTVLFKRYRDSGGLYSSIMDLNFGFNEYFTFHAMGAGASAATTSNNLIGKLKFYNFDLPNIVFRGNTFDNTFSTQCANLTFLSQCGNNNIGRGYSTTAFAIFDGNNIAILLRSIFKLNFQYNVIKYAITDTTINAPAANNEIYSMTNNTITALQFSNNVIDTFTANTINSVEFFRQNDLQSFSNNTVSQLFQNNTFVTITFCNFPRSVENNRGLALQYVNFTSNITKKLQFNNFDCYITGTAGTPIDLSLATHVYNSYTCKIYKNANGDIKISYYNAGDAEVSALITT